MFCKFPPIPIPFYTIWHLHTIPLWLSLPLSVSLECCYLAILQITRRTMGFHFSYKEHTYQHVGKQMFAEERVVCCANQLVKSFARIDKSVIIISIGVAIDSINGQTEKHDNWKLFVVCLSACPVLLAVVDKCVRMWKSVYMSVTYGLLCWGLSTLTQVPEWHTLCTASPLIGLPFDCRCMRLVFHFCLQ